MKAEELRELDAEELGGRLKGARRELYELRFKLAVGQQDNHREIRKARKEIARILTVVHQRRLGALEREPYAAEGQHGGQKGGREGGEAVESRSPGTEPAGEVETAPSTREEAEPQDAETASASGPAEGEPNAARDGEEQADVEAGRQRRRRSGKAGNEDEG